MSNYIEYNDKIVFFILDTISKEIIEESGLFRKILQND